MQPEEWTAHRLSVEFNISYHVANRRLRNVQPVRVDGQKKYYRIADAAPALLGGAEGEILGFEEARNRKMAAEAQLLELDLMVKRGELMPVGEVSTDLDRTFGAVRSKLLAIPSKLAPVLSPKDPFKAQRLLDAEMSDVLAELQTADDDDDVRNVA